MKKVFIDCGGNQGQSIENFKEHWEDWEEYEIHSFEPRPDLVECFNKFENNQNIKFHNKAVGINNGNVLFYLSETTNFGSSVIKDKEGVMKTPILVESICFDDFINKNFSTDDYIVVKLDIEGGEYELIPYLLLKNTFKFINKLYIELHHGKVGKKTSESQSLIKSILDRKNNKTEVIDNQSWLFRQYFPNHEKNEFCNDNVNQSLNGKKEDIQSTKKLQKRQALLHKSKDIQSNKKLTQSMKEKYWKNNLSK